MKRVSADSTFTLVLLAVALLLLVLTLRLGASARLVPLIVVVPLTALLTYRLVRDLVGTADAPPSETASHGTSDAEPSPTTELAMIAWLLALPLVASLLGFVAGPAAFVLAWTKFRAGERLWIAIASALVTGAAVWLIFERLLRIPLPPGAWRALLNG